jgi:transcriptional regulator of acetoin/glycerol metabolism
LQDHEVKSLGGGRQQIVDFVLMCATHRDLKAMAAEGSFRTDLYYRLQHFVVVLPALREQAEVKGRIDELLQTLLPSRKLRLSPQAREALLAYTWSGNWRQLVAVTQTLLALADPGSCIELADLPDEIRSDWRTHQKQPLTALLTSARSGPEWSSAAMSPVPLRAMTDLAIQAAIASCNGNVSRAARLLGVHRSTLYRHLIHET